MRSARRRGFTLIELMVAMAIIAILASVAIPSFSRMSLRAKAAERAAIMTAIARAIEEVAQSQQHLPNWDPANPGGMVLFIGAANPPVMPGTTRRPLVWTLPGWSQLPLIVEGSSYYQYSFWALDMPAAHVTLMLVQGNGDLDGDGTISQRWALYQGVGYSFQQTNAFPPPGVNEDVF